MLKHYSGHITLSMAIISMWTHNTIGRACSHIFIIHFSRGIWNSVVQVSLTPGHKGCVGRVVSGDLTFAGVRPGSWVRSIPTRTDSLEDKRNNLHRISSLQDAEVCSGLSTSSRSGRKFSHKP